MLIAEMSLEVVLNHTYQRPYDEHSPLFHQKCGGIVSLKRNPNTNNSKEVLIACCSKCTLEQSTSQDQIVNEIAVM